MFKEVSEEGYRFGKEIVNVAFHVHKQLGSGLMNKKNEEL
jgi:hypothetical protein